MASQQPIVQLANRDSLAYNFACVPYDHKLTNRQTHQVLRVREFQSSKEEPKLSTPPLTLTPQEGGEDGKAAVWIGMLPNSSTSYKNSNLPDKGEPSKPRRTQSVANTQSTFVVQNDPDALRAVAAMSGESVKVYALINQQNGLCFGARANKDEVFYFPEFRDDSIEGLESRNQAWMGIIKKFRAEYSQRSAIGHGKKLQTGCAINIPWEQDLVNEIQGLAASYTLCPEDWQLSALTKALERWDRDLAYAPAFRYEGLHAMLEIGNAFGKEKAATAIVDIMHMWPELKVLQIENAHILMLAQGLRDAKICLEYRLIRAVIVDWVKNVKAVGDAEGIDLGRLAAEVREHVLLMLGALDVENVSLESAPFDAFLGATVDSLKSLVNYASKYETAMESALGGHVPAASLEVVAQQFQRTPDVDGAKAWQNEGLRVAIKQLQERDKGLAKHLGTLIQSIGQFRASVKQTLTIDATSNMDSMDVE